MYPRSAVSTKSHALSLALLGWRRKCRKCSIALIASTFVSVIGSAQQPSHAAALTFSQNPNPFQAFENTPGNIDFLNVVNPNVEGFFITSITVSTLVHAAGEFDDQAKNLVIIAPNPNVADPLDLAGGGNFNIKFSWDAVDDIEDNDVDSGDWLAQVVVTGHLAMLGDQLSFYSAKFRVNDTPLPAALPLFATGLGALGLLGWRRKRKVQAVA